MATGGVLTAGVDPAHPSLTVEELRVVADVAHSTGKRVTTHAIGNAGIKNALRAGIEAGLTPMQALVAGTRHSAENVDLLHDVGTVEVGKLADLVVVDSDPTTDITAMRDVVVVLKEGTVYRDDRSAAGHVSTSAPAPAPEGSPSADVVSAPGAAPAARRGACRC